MSKKLLLRLCNFLRSVLPAAHERPRFHTQPRKKMKVSILIKSVTSVTSKKSLKKGEPLELNCLVSKLWFHLNICVNYQIFQLFLCKFSNSSCYWCHQCHQKNGDERNYVLIYFLMSSVSPELPAKKSRQKENPWN